MAFKRTQTPTFPADVTVPVPNDKGGHDKNTFVAIFKRTTTDELRALQEQQLSDMDLVLDRMVDWELEDADSKESVPFSHEALKAVLQIQPSPKFIARAFYEKVTAGKI